MQKKNTSNTKKLGLFGLVTVATLGATALANAQPGFLLCGTRSALTRHRHNHLHITSVSLSQLFLTFTFRRTILMKIITRGEAMRIYYV